MEVINNRSLVPKPRGSHKRTYLEALSQRLVCLEMHQVSVLSSVDIWEMKIVLSGQQRCNGGLGGTGPAKTVEFDFDLGADTAMSVASEMVEDLSLSAEDAKNIAAAIREEIKLLTGIMERRGKDSLASSSDTAEVPPHPDRPGDSFADHDGALGPPSALQPPTTCCAFLPWSTGRLWK